MLNYIDKLRYILLHKSKGYRIKDGAKYHKVWIVDKRGRRTTKWKRIDEAPEEKTKKNTAPPVSKKKSPKKPPKKNDSKEPKNENPKPIKPADLKPEKFKIPKANKLLLARVPESTLDTIEKLNGIRRSRIPINFQKELSNAFGDSAPKVGSKEYSRCFDNYLMFLHSKSSYVNPKIDITKYEGFLKYLIEAHSKDSTHKITKHKAIKLKSNRFKDYKSGDKELLTSRSELTVLPKTDYTNNGELGALTHQIDTANLAMQNFENGNKSFMIADGTGAGKTISSLTTAMAFLRNEGMQKKHGNKPIIIVTESDAIIDDAWFGDAKKMGIDHLLVNGKTEGLFHPGKIVVTTYSQISKLKEMSKTKNKPGLVIFDESHNLKNSKGKRAKDAFEVIDNVSHCLMATATPVDKIKHIEYLCRANNLDYELVKRAVTVNARKLPRYNRKHLKSVLEAYNLSSLFDDFTRKGLMVKREVSLKNIDFEMQEVSLNSNQEEVVDRMLNAYIEGKARGDRSGLMNLRRGLEQFKIKHTIDLVQKEIKAGRQVVIFAENVGDFDQLSTSSEGTLPQIKKELQKLGISHDSIFGGSPTKADRKRNKKAMENFQSGKSKVIFGNIASMGTGISLDDQTGKSPRTMVIMTPPFSAMGFTQAIGRISRLKTKSRSKVILPFISGKAKFVDMWMNGILSNKIRSLGASVKGDISEVELYGQSVPSKSQTGVPININDFKVSNSTRLEFSKGNIWRLFFKSLENKVRAY